MKVTNKKVLAKSFFFFGICCGIMHFKDEERNQKKKKKWRKIENISEYRKVYTYLNVLKDMQDFNKNLVVFTLKEEKI